MKADEGVRGRVKAVMAATVFVAVRWHHKRSKEERTSASRLLASSDSVSPAPSRGHLEVKRDADNVVALWRWAGDGVPLASPHSKGHSRPARARPTPQKERVDGRRVAVRRELAAQIQIFSITLGVGEDVVVP